MHLDHIAAIGPKFEECVRRGRMRYGDRFDASKLLTVDPSIMAAYESGNRVKIRTIFDDGTHEDRTGIVSTTTSWVPCFLLMHRSNDSGSWQTLNERDTVIAVWDGRKYQTSFIQQRLERQTIT